MQGKIESSNFANAVRVLRFEKDKLVFEGDMVKPLSFGRKPFHKDQILFETETYFLVSPIRVLNRPVNIFTVTLDPGWNIVTDFVEGQMKGRGRDTGKLIRPGFGIETVHMADVDKALNILQDMGRWDMAFRIVMDLLDVKDVVPVTSVVWEKFPHKSKMLFFTSEGTGVYLGGVLKDIVEKWFAYCGGYHNKKGILPLVPDEDYVEFMNSVRNPFILAGVNRDAARASLSKHFHPVEWLPEEVTADQVKGRDYWVSDGVIYLEDVDGFVLPYWYTNLKGEEPAKRAWGPELRTKLAAHMNLPLLVQRWVEKELA